MNMPTQESRDGLAAPHSAGQGSPGFELPTGACDCHMHLFDNRLPFASNAVLVHNDASADDYQRLQRRLGLARNVIVQPSSYGRDHRVLLAGLRALGPAARGIAVIDPDVSDEELSLLQAGGVVGVRFNLVQHGATDESMLEAVAQRIQPMGWHLQLHLHGQDLLRLADRLADLPVPIVLDHFARVHADGALASQISEQVEHLLDLGSAWLKLSAPYIASGDRPGYPLLHPFVQRLLRSHSDRLVWGTDWPHVTEANKPDDARLLDLLARWAPDALLRRRILVDNPCRLYGFAT
ncbi:amidohydrolase family protein [Azohydromonas lata]|uniref:Amidohydrolase family protein n=1 Tax=Azohydromonas lata TaxID=45677 RepID=A0ABU5IQM6_9BURK|nr:amidohydrolase family protein [Azohydromonas lata]MDZ5461196.1 amidohydrolase family protein [Azohydromonas lata]